MKMRHIVSVTFFIISSLIVYLYFHLGAYKSVTLELKEQGPFLMVYKEHIGPYHKIVPLIEEVEKWAKSKGESCVKSFGEFLDDPKSVEQERLRSHAGCIISKTIQGLPEGYQFKELPKQLFLYGVFDGSPAIGPYKVYMKAAKYMEEKGYTPNGSVTEVYEILPNNKMTTEYYFKIKSKY
jgi:effector-binding domain-containing protein